MLWKKSCKNVYEYPNEWKVVKATNQTGAVALMVSVNIGLHDAAGHPEYPIRMGVAVPVDNLPEANPSLNALEDKIAERLKKDGSGIHALTISGLLDNPFKEFVFYTKKDIDFKKLHDELKEMLPSFDVQMYAENDPSWSTYQEYLRK